MNKGIISILFAAASLSAAYAQSEMNEPIVLEPLFEYPQAPDSIQDLQSRSDYLMDHFWDAMDFKGKHTVDQNALNDAFSVYTTPMQFASAEKVEQSLTALLGKIAKNQALTLQFAKAAEETLYGPRASAWNDKIYLRFIDQLISSKNIKDERKLRYKRHKKLISATMRGTVPPEFDYTRPDGSTAHYLPNGVITVIEFGDPDCDDCRMAKLKMETNVAFSDLVDKGKVNVLFIDTNKDEGWEKKLAGYPSNWHVGASEEVEDLYDMRGTPSLYVIDREGRVAAKNISVATAMAIAAAAAAQ